MKLFGSLSRLVSILFRKDGQDVTVRPSQSTTYTAARDVQLPPGDADHVLVSAASTQTLTNKTLGTGTVITATGVVGDAQVAAGIDAAKLADGSVSNTEFQYLNGVTSGIQGQLNDKIPASEKGANSGVATLDSNGKVPVAQLPSSVMEYKGAWNASTNSPSLADGTGDLGDLYRVSVAGSQNLGSGSITFFVGDWVIYNGSVWQRSPAADFAGYANTALSNLSVASLAAESLLVGSSSTAVESLAVGSTGQVLTVVAGAVEWANPAGASFSGSWVTGDGTTKAITHSLGSKDVHVTIYDMTDDQTILVDTIVRTSTSVVTLTASEAPGAAGWRVVVSK
jgi:hypothetical protein